MSGAGLEALSAGAWLLLRYPEQQHVLRADPNRLRNSWKRVAAAALVQPP